MYLDVKYNFRPNPKCKAEVVRYVETMYSFKEVNLYNQKASWV